MNKRPRSVTVCWAFILLNIFVWSMFGLIVGFAMHPALPDIPLFRETMAGLSFAIVVALIMLLVFLTRRSRAAFYLALIFFCAISLMTFFDDMGPVDFTVLAINIIPIALLIKDREWYLKPQP